MNQNDIQDRSGQDRSGQDRSGQDRSGKTRRTTGSGRRALMVAGSMVLCLALILFGKETGAAGMDPYSIAGIHVDRIDQTAAAAREQALASAHRQAFTRLTARLVPRADQAQLPPITAPEIVSLVHSFAISDEKTSGVRYLANLTFRFRDAAVRAYLRSNDVRFADTVSKPVLILPLYESAGALHLWDRPNPWFDAWTNLPAATGLIPILLPEGDYADIRLVTAEQVAAADRERLAAVATRYGAASVLSVHARHRIRTEALERAVEVQLRWFGDVHDGRAETLTHVPSGKEGPDGAILSVARATADWIEEDWKQDNLFRFDLSGSVIVRISLGKLEDWISIRRRLGAVTLLRGFRLLSVSRREAIVTLDHYGTGRQLQIAAAQQDLVLKSGTPHWRLHLGRHAFDTDQETGKETPRP